jgi:hypothetical protein
MALFEIVLTLTGACALVTLITLWLSPHACRWLAALLLVQASSAEAQREERRRAWARLDVVLAQTGARDGGGA